MLAAFEGVVEFGQHLSRRQMPPREDAAPEFGYYFCLLSNCQFGHHCTHAADSMQPLGGAKESTAALNCKESTPLCSSPLVPSDPYGCWEGFPHGLHKLLKLSFRDQPLFLIVVFKQLVLFHNVGVASSPSLKHTTITHKKSAVVCKGSETEGRSQSTQVTLCHHGESGITCSLSSPKQRNW